MAGGAKKSAILCPTNGAKSINNIPGHQNQYKLMSRIGWKNPDNSTKPDQSIDVPHDKRHRFCLTFRLSPFYNDHIINVVCSRLVTYEYQLRCELHHMFGSSAVLRYTSPRFGAKVPWGLADL